ncbi:single-stranded DNA-binding protein [Metamycoplasma auris]|nr:single-stranded DNA-binding protein [Metamycoplasma auris]
MANDKNLNDDKLVSIRYDPKFLENVTIRKPRGKWIDYNNPYSIQKIKAIKSYMDEIENELSKYENLEIPFIRDLNDHLSTYLLSIYELNVIEHMLEKIKTFDTETYMRCFFVEYFNFLSKNRILEIDLLKSQLEEGRNENIGIDYYVYDYYKKNNTKLRWLENSKSKHDLVYIGNSPDAAQWVLVNEKYWILEFLKTLDLDYIWKWNHNVLEDRGEFEKDMAKKEIIGINQTKKENTIYIDGYVLSDEYYIKEFKKDDVVEGKLLKFKLHNIKDKKHNYFDIVAWNKTADYIKEKINKEDYIRIEGHLESNSYLKDNEKVYTINIIADHVELVQSLEEQYELEKQRKKEEKAKLDELPEDYDGLTWDA